MDIQFKSLPQGLTFDDVLLLPGYTDFTRSDIDLSTKVSKNLALRLPLVSSPMDTVTDANLAISLAKLGGIGIIHRSFSISDQVRQVQKVKKANQKVGAAIGTLEGFQERVDALIKANVDLIVVDSAHGHTSFMVNTVTHIKKKYPQAEVVAGNIATAEGAETLIQAGADGLRIGMGPGSICTTRIISGMGVPQITAILQTSKIAQKHNVPVIADGGIKYSGDIVKALAAGASTVMLGSLFAGTNEAPGEVIELEEKRVPARFRSILNGTKKYMFKRYRGMGSLPAMKKGSAIQAEDEFHGKNYKEDSILVAEGVEGLTPYKGSVVDVVEQLVGGIRSGFYYLGARNLKELWQKAKFIQITQASLGESHPHDILVTDPGENYQ